MFNATVHNFVNSTAIRFIAYDAETSTLRVIFQAGTGYDFQDVSRIEYVRLAQARSVGVYFGQHIRNQYATTRLTSSEVTLFTLDLAQQMQANALLRQ